MTTTAATPRRSHYQQRIAERLAVTGRLGIDPRHIEAFMRLEYGTLDHLSAAAFDREIATGVECVETCGSDEAEALASSFGL